MSSTKQIFLKQFDNFIDELILISNNNKEILLFYEQYKMLKSMNSKLIIESFIQYVYPHNKKIRERDEEFFLNGGGQDVLKDDASLHLRDTLSNLWKTELDENKKNIIWKYMLAFCLLSEKYIIENNIS